MLAPEPDFRYVGLESAPRVRPSTWASILGLEMTLGAGLIHQLGARGLALAGAGALMTAIALQRNKRTLKVERGAKLARPMAIVPWGILVDPDATARALRWAAVRRVTVEMVHERDGGSATTLFSVVSIETAHEKLTGRAHGAVGIERLLAYLHAWADEQQHLVALDLEGARAADGPLEPVFEPLLSAARAIVQRGGEAAARLGLAAGYRASAKGASSETIEVLGTLLRDRAPRSPDPRALAAVLAAELRAEPLARDLVSLVQSPHPIVAGAAKAAAHKLGVVAAKVGSVDEVAPFLHERDVDALAGWVG